MTDTTPFSLRLAWAQGLFERSDYAAAATALANLVDEAESRRAGHHCGDGSGDGVLDADDAALLHGTSDLRLLLARAYYHSAQFNRAEAVLTGLIEQCPTDAYAHLLLGRTLQRAGRPAEAARPLALAQVLGDYEVPGPHGSQPEE